MFIQPQRTLNLETGNFLSSTMPCTAYCPMTPRRQLPFDEGLHISIMIRRWRHFTAVHTMVYSFDAYPIQRHRKYIKKLIMAYAVPISQVQSSKTECVDLAIIGQRWSLTQCSMQNGVEPVKSTWILCTNPQSYFIQQSPHGLLKPREPMSFDLSVLHS